MKVSSKVTLLAAAHHGGGVRLSCVQSVFANIFTWMAHGKPWWVGNGGTRAVTWQRVTESPRTV